MDLLVFVWLVFFHSLLVLLFAFTLIGRSHIQRFALTKVVFNCTDGNDFLTKVKILIFGKAVSSAHLDHGALSAKHGLNVRHWQ